jgi:superoxide dismutase, Cu-Zn family
VWEASMATKLSALGVPIALLVLVLVLVANGGSSAAPPPEADDDGAAEAGGTRAGGTGADAIARLKDAAGTPVGVVRFEREEGVVEVKASVRNVEPAGEFHGFHVHRRGVCDPESVDPATGSPFYSARGHLELGGEVHGQHAGDFPVLLVQADGDAEARFDTDRFRLGQLFDENGSAVIVHAGRDNYANIPDRYHSHAEDVFGPDSMTKDTGDAGARFACGVVERVERT